MKFSVTKEKLLEGLQQVQNVVSTRTTLPILSNVLLQADEDEIHLTTTDLDVGVRGSCEAHVDKTGATTLPARRLFNIVRELPSSEIQVDVDGKMPLRYAAVKASSKFSGCPKTNFRRCQNSRRRKLSRFGRKICAMVCAKLPMPYRPTRLATCSTVFCLVSRTIS